MLYYRYDRDTKEIKYINGKYDSYIPNKNHKGNLEIEIFSLSANPPAFKNGHTLIADEENNKWIQVEDNRGKKCYRKDDASEHTIDYLGKLKDEYTFLEPIKFGVFDGEKWVIDTEKKKATYIQQIKQKADEKQKAAEVIIAGKFVSNEKKERYRKRLEMIKEYNSSNTSDERRAVVIKSLSLLASSEGKSLDEYIAIVLVVAEEWDMALNMFYSFIDSVENRIIALVDNLQFEDVDTIFDLLDALGKSEDGKTLTPSETLKLVEVQVREILDNFTVNKGGN